MKTLLLISITTILSLPFISCKASHKDIPANHKYIEYFGRVDFTNPVKPRFSFSGVTIKAKFNGSFCAIKLNNYSDESHHLYNVYNVFLDGKLQVVKVENGQHVLIIGKNLTDTIHTLLIFKRTEGFCGIGEFEGLNISPNAEMLPPDAPLNRSIEFIGNSITCGYGNEGLSKECKFTPDTENNYLAYGAITARNLNANYTAVCYSGKGLIRNYDLSEKNTMPVIYDRTLAQDSSNKWDFKKYTPDVVVINLGTNDFAHKNPDSVAFTTAYLDLIVKIKKNYPQASIFCLVGSMINDQHPKGHHAKSTCIRNIKEAIKKAAAKDVYFTELTEQGRNGYGCDWHPNLKQHEINAAELTAFIKSKMNW